jgi:hypothetical protein
MGIGDAMATPVDTTSKGGGRTLLNGLESPVSLGRALRPAHHSGHRGSTSGSSRIGGGRGPAGCR